MQAQRRPRWCQVRTFSRVAQLRQLHSSARLLRLLPSACQSRRKQWRMKKVRRGSYSLPARVVICKLTHHVNSALHIPQQRGGLSTARSTATLALCQRQARHALAGSDGKDSWILMIGAANVDSKYSHEYLHGQAEWRQHVAGKLLACAKADQLLRPEQAKAKFSRYRADTGIKFCIQPLLLVCAAIFVLSAMLPRRKGKSACSWPPRFAPQTRVRTLAAPVAACRAYCSLELCEVAQCCPGAMHYRSTFPSGVADGCRSAGSPVTRQTNCEAACERRRTEGGQVRHKTTDGVLKTGCILMLIWSHFGTLQHTVFVRPSIPLEIVAFFGKLLLELQTCPFAFARLGPSCVAGASAPVLL